MQQPQVVWFRRDLRLSDNPAIEAAASARGPVLGVFVIDPALWGPAGDVRKAYLLASLHALNASMGGRLVVRRGKPADVLARLVGEVGARQVHVSADYGPYGSERDSLVARSLASANALLLAEGSPYAVEPGTVRKADGTPYRVFTPFYNAWNEQGWDRPTPQLDVTWIDAGSDPWPAAPTPPELTLPQAGESAARERWQHFIDGGLDEYAKMRDRPDFDGTSSLSTALRWGEIHPRTLLERLDDSDGHEVFRKELCWREFYADVLHHAPESARNNLRSELVDMRVDTGPTADLHFEAWARGLTGYPLVDAGMRQLRAEGWMHNRVRMVVASFLVKDLHLPWQRGAAHFMRWLRDGDLASNQHGWQWTAGTGTDAAPYFRVFNPVTQGIRFDPHGDYVRRYIPELHALTGVGAQEPWKAPLLTSAYPDRIVDHSVERLEALARLAEVSARS